MKSSIDLRGDFLGTGSYSMLARELYYALSSRMDMTIRLEHVPSSNTQLDSEPEVRAHIQASNSIEPSPIKIHVGPPPYSIQPNQVNICWDMANTASVSQNVIDAWKQFNYVIVSSSKKFERLKKEVDPNKFGYFPFPVDTNMFNPDIPEITVLNVTHDLKSQPVENRPFIFGACGVWHARSGLAKVLRGYFSEFSGDDNVALVLKTSDTNRGEAGMQGIKDVINNVRNAVRNPSPPKIFILPAVLSDNDYSQFISVCDAFVSGSSWDSLHPGIHHAMACNKIVVAPDYDGQVEYLNKTMCLTYKSSIQPVYESADALTTFGEKWYEGDVSNMMAAMRSAFNSGSNPDSFKKIRMRAKEYIEKICNADAVVQGLCQVLANGVPIKDSHPEIYAEITRGAQGALA